MRYARAADRSGIAVLFRVFLDSDFGNHSRAAKAGLFRVPGGDGCIES